MQAWEGRQVRDVAALIERIRSGTEVEESFRLLFKRYYRLVKRYFAERGMAPEDCENLSQETFLAVYRALPELRRGERFDGWLFSIARRVFADEVRRKVAHRKRAPVVSLEGQPEGIESVLSPPDLEPLQQALDRERRQQLYRSLEGLPEQMRQCAALRLGHGLKYREIAGVLGISEDAVHVQLARARRRLKRELTETFGGSST